MQYREKSHFLTFVFCYEHFVAPSPFSLEISERASVLEMRVSCSRRREARRAKFHEGKLSSLERVAKERVGSGIITANL